MLTTIALTALGAEAPTLEDEHDARYLERSGRAKDAAAWYLAHRDDDPTSAKHLLAYLRLLGQLPDHRSLALVRQVEAWSEGHPEAADRGVAVAIAHSLVTLGPYDWSSPFHEGGAWCEPARAALETIPEGGRERYRVLQGRAEVAEACGGDAEAAQAELVAYAMSGGAGAATRAWYGTKDGVDEDDLTAVRGALGEGWWTLSDLTAYAKPDMEGPGAEEARRLVLERARSLATSDRPAEVAAAIRAFAAAKVDDEAKAARQRLAELDPGNESNRRALDAADRDEPEDDEPDPTTILDPVARLAALRGSGPPKGGGWTLVTYWDSRATAAKGAGDLDEELEALERLWHVDPGTGGNLRFVEAALAAGERLGAARRAADAAVSNRRDPWRYRTGKDAEDEDDWREDLAEALATRARVSVVRGEDEDAIEDLEEALLLAAPTPDRLARLGLLYAKDREPRDSAPLLATGLVGLAEDDPLRAEARAALTEALGDQPGWAPDVDTYVEAVRAGAIRPAAPLSLDGSRFAELAMKVGDADRKLFDIEGPIVLDVWATWCGPCKQSLPHLDELARTYAGRVTFVAASVDVEREAAEKYLAKRGEPAFVSAWLGGDGMDEVGVNGIPAMFVFDADHELVAKLSGWGPGSRALDEAVEKALAED